MEPLAIAAIAIGLLAAIAVAGWWAFAASQKLVGELLFEVKALRKGAEVHDDADEILARSVATGGKLRSSLLARAERGLSKSSPVGEASAPTGP